MESGSSSQQELVVLLDAEGRPCGTAPKQDVHHRETPLHLAFSCYVLDADGKVLVTRRALTKTAWPGVWTNSFCGHPAPGEDMVDALRRRSQWELGITISSVELRLPGFRYRAVPGLLAAAESAPWAFSPWLVLQLKELGGALNGPAAQRPQVRRGL